MPNQLVTVDAQTLDFPQAVKNKLAEYFPTIAHANNIAESRAGQFVNLNSSSTAEANKIAKRDSNGFFEVLDAVSAKQPVSLSQLDARVPEGGYSVASQLQNGLMSSADKTKLDKATGSATGSTVVSRFADGASNFSQIQLMNAPTLGNHGTTKAYVDTELAKYSLLAHQHDATDLTSGLVPVARLPLVTTSANGAMLATDKSKLDKATHLATPNTLVSTDANGRFQSATPSATADVTTKGYVDGKKWAGTDITTGLIDPARIANATSALDGLMSKADKAILDGASTSGTGNIVMRNSTGATNLDTLYLASAPMAVTSATRKDYVDAQVATRAPANHSHSGADITSGVLPLAVLPVHTHSGADITTGTISPDRIANATSALDGLMSKADKATLDSATGQNTGSAIVRRYSDGTISTQQVSLVGAPTATSHATRKDYVDAQIATRAPSSHNHNGSDITSGTVPIGVLPVVSASANGIMLSTDKTKLDGATSLSSNSTLAMRNSTGGIVFDVVGIDKAPTSAQHATRKDYVDAQVATRAPSSHNHDGSDITTGLINQARIANATSSLNGLMSSADKAKLDASSAGFTASVLAIRDSNGNLNANGFFTPSGSSQSIYAHSLTRKDYVDGLIAQQVTLAGELGSTDLNTVITPGDYYASGGANATTTNNYPFNGAVGTLSVRRFHSSSVWVTQALTVWSKNEIWVRSANSATGWTAWMLQATTSYVDGKTWSGADITTGTISPLRIANATSSLDGLMSKADKAKLDKATPASTANTLVLSDSAGRFQVPAPSTNSLDVVNKGYVDGKTWSGTDITTGTIDPARIANATSSVDGLMSKADKAKLDGASSSSTANTIMMTDSAGRFRVNTPSATTDATNKAYVDGKTWDGSDITTGLINQARIANATASLNGLMSSTDKAKLDGAVYHSTGASLVMSSSAGYIKGTALYVDENTPQQTQAHAVTRKDYVDGKVADVFVGTEIPDNADLNNYTKPGVYHNSTNASVGTGSNYPSTWAGKLEVSTSGSGSTVYQTWTDYSSAGRIYYRTKYSTSWYAWKELINNLNVTAESQDNLTTLNPEASGFTWDSYKSPNTYVLESTFTNGILEVFKSGSVIYQRRTYTYMQTGDFSLKIALRYSVNGGSTWNPWRIS